MRKNITISWLYLAAGGALALHLTTPAAAQDCADPALPAEFSNWASPAAQEAAPDEGHLDDAAITVGQAVEVTLRQTQLVTYPVRPAKPVGSVSHGGLLRFHVPKAGTYRIALGTPAWIDVLKGTEPLVSSAHGHGPECSGIRKIVDFDLTPGTYTLQVSASASAQVSVLLVPAA
ncbi:hypothetical protein [Novosphingobium profundi]|uniref:hypothetical protein n=1 Tax=Novosphingobium profundi TaxID=1774954 RepID=UPI001CFF0E67|nr:hypothetical protein [Novosphingobium profundi]